MKRFILSGAISLWLVAVIVITAMAFTACSKKSETQTDFNIYSVWRYVSSADEEYYEWFSESGFVPDLGFSSTHQEILTVDISAFTGTWVNSERGTFTIPQPHSWEKEFPGGFKQFEDYYTWWHPAGDFGIYLVPAGVDLILHGNVIPTDNTKIRLVTEDLHSAPGVYYREGETPAQNNTAGDPQLMLLGGRVWHFQSGEWLYFFQHFRELTTVFFYSDGNVHVTSEETSLSVSGKWKITDDGRLEIRPDNQRGELNIPEILYFSYQIRGNILTLTDNNPNFGKAGDEGIYYEVFPHG